MHYKPRWRRIILASVVLHLILLAVISMFWSGQTQQPEEDKVEEIEWVDVDVADNSAPAEEKTPIETPKVESVPEFEFPPIELPPIPEPVYTEPPPPPPLPTVERTPPPEIKPDIRETMEDKVSKKIEDELGKEKTYDDPAKKIKVISKVYPRDIVNELIEAGFIKTKGTLKAGKTVVAVTIGTDGRVKNAEIRRGGGNDENGNTINVLIEAAASRWVFEPFIDNDGNMKEIKTQIEFKPEDF